jgi:hypothetical protein
VDAFYFFGPDGWRALSLDESGASLPVENGPWTPHKNVRIDPDTPAGQALRNGRDHVYQSEDSQRA